MENNENALKEIEKKWEEIVDVFVHNYSVDKYKIKTKRDKEKFYKIYIVEKDHRNTSTQFIIRYEKDGKDYEWESGEREAAQAMVNFITEVGIEDVYNLKISAKRVGLLITDSISQRVEKNYEKVGNKYIYKKSENEEKITIIQEIIEKLGLRNASIEKIIIKKHEK